MSTSQNTTPTTTIRTGAADKFDQVWARTSDADKQVLLGHTNPVLTAADKIRLAKKAGALGTAVRAGGRTSGRRRTGR